MVKKMKHKQSGKFKWKLIALGMTKYYKVSTHTNKNNEVVLINKIIH